MNKCDRTAPTRDVAREEATQAAPPGWASALQSARDTFTREAGADAAVEQMPAIKLRLTTRPT